MLKWHYSTVRSMKTVAVLTEDGAFALFFRPHPGGFDSSRVPTPGNLPSKAKKMLMPRGQHVGGGSLGPIRRSWKSGKAYVFEPLKGIIVLLSFT